MPAAAAPRWNAIVVAGGRATRLGGIDKTALVYRGRSLLAGVLGAVANAERTCVVGSDAPLSADVLRAVEEPRWGGPAAAIVAGLRALAEAGVASADAGGVGSGGAGAGGTGADWVVVLAADLVRADRAVAALLTALTALQTSTRLGAAEVHFVDGLISVDTDGHRQPLLAVYRRVALESAAAAHGAAQNLSVKGLTGALNLVELALPAELSDDVDTAGDAARLGIVVPGQTAPPGDAEPWTPRTPGGSTASG